MEPILIASLLFVVAIAFVVLDLFLPSGGVLILLGGFAALGSVLFGFRSSLNVGMTFVILVLGSIPCFLFFFVKVWPSTKFGRRLLGERPKRSEFHWASAHKVANIQGFVGCYGRATVEMMPAGEVEIDGTRFDAISDGRPIPLGKRIRVLRIDMGRLVVIECEQSIIPNRSTPGAIEETSHPHSEKNLLNLPIEELGLESLKDQDHGS